MVVSRPDRGQSLVELALALPLLLVILVGIADVARAFYYSQLLANAAREGALYASNRPDATDAEILQRVCDATGLVEVGGSCPDLTITTPVVHGRGVDAVVEATYQFSLVFTSLADRFAPVGPLRIRATATFEDLAP